VLEYFTYEKLTISLLSEDPSTVTFVRIPLPSPPPLSAIIYAERAFDVIFAGVTRLVLVGFVDIGRGVSTVTLSTLIPASRRWPFLDGGEKIIPLL